MKYIPDIIFWLVVILTNLFLVREFITSRQQSNLSADEAEKYVAAKLGVTQWKARLILLEEKEKMLKRAVTELLEAGIITEALGQVDKYGEPLYEFTEYGANLLKNTAKVIGNDSDMLKINMDHLIASHRDKKDPQ